MKIQRGQVCRTLSQKNEILDALLLTNSLTDRLT